ncbi:TetR/AcrR family transcriptional regulator [Kineosporia succinea]|uniref:AcrR family transcriptional regulator n=1 Tax=Kineosporia succinea TaxID=84632 RepID=A0ABT9PDD3_9ACTN|nr:TetR family transcriptional regulator [Kineosporia succinea]MDP9830722.1 AcrR family transcriptional regulator [Kineosporia succinea]
MPEGSGRSYRRASERRAEVIEAAIELFAARGVSTSLRNIGDAIGVSHAALRYHFPSRDELLVDVYRAHEHSFADPLEANSAVAGMRASAERNRGIPGLVELYATLTTDALQGEEHPVTREFITERFRDLRARLREAVVAQQEAGSVPADLDPGDVAALIIAASDGLQLQWLLEPGAVDVERSLAVLERLLPGIRE